MATVCIDRRNPCIGDTRAWAGGCGVNAAADGTGKMKRPVVSSSAVWRTGQWSAMCPTICSALESVCDGKSAASGLLLAAVCDSGAILRSISGMTPRTLINACHALRERRCSLGNVVVNRLLRDACIGTFVREVSVDMEPDSCLIFITSRYESVRDLRF